MNEANLFHVDFDVIRKLYTHQGILGKGRDFVYDLPCEIHLMMDKISQKKVAMQTFNSLTTDILKKKMLQLAKANLEFYVSNQCRMLFFSSKKISEDMHSLSVVYDIHGIVGQSLENVITARKKDGKFFSEDEVLDVIKSLVQAQILGGVRSQEYLDLNPVNIFMVENGGGPGG